MCFSGFAHNINIQHTYQTIYLCHIFVLYICQYVYYTPLLSFRKILDLSSSTKTIFPNAVTMHSCIINSIHLNYILYSTNKIRITIMTSYTLREKTWKGEQYITQPHHFKVWFYNKTTNLTQGGANYTWVQV